MKKAYCNGAVGAGVGYMCCEKATLLIVLLFKLTITIYSSSSALEFFMYTMEAVGIVGS